MKIINLEALRKMPEGTVFCKYEPCAFGMLEMFGGPCGDIDFMTAELTAYPDSSGSNEMYDILNRCQESGESFKLDTECYGRDGLFEEGQLFAVYEREDVEQLIETLKKAIRGTATIREFSHSQISELRQMFLDETTIENIARVDETAALIVSYRGGRYDYEGFQKTKSIPFKEER